ncbi:MAG TPA: PIN domain-containing protein [Thermoplasmata archaeon]
MKALLDTTYLLPAIGVAVSGVARDAVLRVREAGHRTVASAVSVLEVAAKGGKLVAERRLDRRRLVRGLRAIAADRELDVVPVEREDLLVAAADLRSLHPDFLDCVLLATAAAESDVFLTEDRGLLRLARSEAFRRIARPVARGFATQRAAQLLRPEEGRRGPAGGKSRERR